MSSNEARADPPASSNPEVAIGFRRGAAPATGMSI